MNLRNTRYMKNTEFKARQLWLPFVDAAGIALQVMADVKESAWAWFKAWKKRPPRPRAENPTLPLPFDHLTHREWQRRASKVYLPLESA